MAPSEAEAGRRARAVLAALTRMPTGRRPPVILIDGRSGSGKSTLADALIAAWPEPALVRLEHIYPGWDGLDAASTSVHDDILVPFAAGEEGGWQRWDWTSDAPADRHPVDAATPLVIEGAGALSRSNRGLATLGVWIDLDSATRKQRALDRDGERYAPHWDRWAAQEEVFAARERPRELADLVLTG